jgi:hypothetical protein
MTRRRAVAVALAACAAVVAGACGDDDAGGAAGGVTAPPASTPTSGAAGPTEAPTTGGGATTATTGTAPAPSTSAVPAPPPAPGEGPARLDPVVAPGAFAPALLRPDLSQRLLVEVHADIAPRPETLEHVEALLADVAAKPVSVVATDAPGGGDRDWTSAELVAAADAGATTAQGGGVAVVRLLFVAGSFEGDDSVLGVAVRGDIAAVFLDRVRDAAGLLGASAGVEAAVAAHELGHLLGLVDLHLDTGRADPEHPGHSRNPRSVMYWAVESSLVGQLLGADVPRDFDADDRADLATIRAGG